MEVTSLPRVSVLITVASLIRTMISRTTSVLTAVMKSQPGRKKAPMSSVSCSQLFLSWVAFLNNMVQKLGGGVLL